MAEKVLNLGEDKGKVPIFLKQDPALVQRATDPVLSPTPYVQPIDFDAQYPVPLDVTEIIAMCEEVTLLQALPEIRTSLNSYTWREMNELFFTGGVNFLSFEDGGCPEEYTHDGDNTTVDIKNLGAKKTLSVRDITHSRAVAAAGWNGINRLVGGFPSGEGLPGGSDMATFQREVVADVKEKEIRTAMTLVLNGWDDLLVGGDHVGNAEEFTGIESWATNYSCTFHTNDNSASGTFDADAFDRFLSESCAKPTVIAGHPQAIQSMLSDYFQLGFQGSQVVQFADGGRITPGFNFAGFVNTGVGRLAVIADNNFRRNNIAGGNMQVDLWALRMTHNGEPLVYKITQVPLSLNDLVPGCTAISFQVWAATALVIKACCAQGRYQTQITGRITTTCTTIG